MFSCFFLVVKKITFTVVVSAVRKAVIFSKVGPQDKTKVVLVETLSKECQCSWGEVFDMKRFSNQARDQCR